MEKLFPLERTADRLTALMKLEKGNKLPLEHLDNQDTKTQAWQGIELLVLEGSCMIDKKVYQQGSYLRLPRAAQNATIKAATDCIVFVKYNQFLSNDNGTRIIDSTDTDHWLPGPVEGIEIRPLHVYDTESIMLLRWHHAAEFKPNLNPRGEEILVMNGLLQNRDHLYRQFSWIRNPIEDWRKWHGNTGTLIYYKSGHFPDDPIRLIGR